MAAALEQAAAGDSDSAPGAAGSSTSRSSSNRGSARDGGPEPCSSAPPGPRLGEVVRTALQRHVEPEVAWYGDYDEGERCAAGGGGRKGMCGGGRRARAHDTALWCRVSEGE